MEIRALRAAIGLSQVDLARRCGVTQQAVSQWEAGTDIPKPKILWRLAEIAAPIDASRHYFEREIAEASGIADFDEQRVGLLRNLLSGTAERRGGKQKSGQASGAQSVAIPLLKDSIAAGTPRAMDEKNVERELSIPQEWLPAANRSGKGLIGVRVAGDSMSPIIEPGYVVLIDTQAKDPRKLLNKMVAAREDEGVTVKWLRKEGRYYQLVPQNTSLRNPVRVLDEENQEKWGIVGEVVKWIGEPPPARGRR